MFRKIPIIELIDNRRCQQRCQGSGSSGDYQQLMPPQTSNPLAATVPGFS